MKTIKYPDKKEIQKALLRPVFEAADLESLVKKIIDDIRENGDAAVFKYTEKYDKVRISNMLVSSAEFDLTNRVCSWELQESIQIAIENIKKFHAAQNYKEEKIETAPGVFCWRKNVPIDKVGLYIPGGTAPLLSTVLMLAIPAKISGCKEIILCSPPDINGEINPAILLAAKLCGITKFYKIGGVQAIAAMAYGTETIPKVYKIFGPGNQFVTCAKQLVSKDGVAIDMPAGPSEVAVIADDTANPSYVAADLLSQAEHGIDSQVLLITTSENLIENVETELSKQLKKLPRKDIAKKALAHSKIILVNTLKEAITISNEYAPEHLILACKDYISVAEKVTNAGSVFLGNYSCESAGDYASGTNHTLPTNGYAKAYSGVSLDSFMKKITFQELTKKGIERIGPAIEIMAEAEQLFGHKNAVTLRLK